MKTRGLLFALFLLPIGVNAASTVNPMGLLPTEVARLLIEQDPSVAAARAGLEVALQEANILDSSPYEWTLYAISQRRRIDNAPRSNEWNFGVERTLRLPGKASADRTIGEVTVEESQARYGDALLSTGRELMTSWVDWLVAERALELSEANLQATRTGLEAVEKRERAGDASKLELSIARAEMAEQRRASIEAKTQAWSAWSHLSSRFVGVKQQRIDLPSPVLIDDTGTFWRDRILAQSDELKLSKTQIRLAQANAERARSDKIPDPTLGFYSASEARNTERISGITISIPLPGESRSARSDKAIASATMARHEALLKQRQIEAQTASAVVMAKGSFESLQIANEGATAMQENAALTQRAYALGEADLQTMLTARRQATAANNTALQARAAALKAYYGLLIDAHLIWDLEHP